MLGLIAFQACVSWYGSTFVVAILVAVTFVIVAVVVAVVAETCAIVT
jgi:hypothetical protein